MPTALETIEERCIMAMEGVPEEIEARIPYLREKHKELATSGNPGAESRWIMGVLRKTATGNINLSELHSGLKIEE